MVSYLLFVTFIYRNKIKLNKEVGENMTEHVKGNELERKARELLTERGVTIDDMAELVFYLQSSYHPNLTLETCKENVERVLKKREVQKDRKSTRLNSSHVAISYAVF